MSAEPSEIVRWRRVSKTVRWVAYTFVAALVLFLAALAVLRTSWFQHVLERRTIATLQSATGARVEVGGFSFRPIILQATLRNLVLHGTEPAGAPPLFRARTLVVGISPSAALRRRALRLRSIVLADAEIHILTFADGSTNVPGPVAGRESQALDQFLDLAVGALNVSRTSLYWNDQRVPLEFSARNVAILLGRGVGGRYSGSLSSSEVRLRVPRWPLPSLTFSTQLQFSRDHLTLSHVVWRFPGLDGSGSFNLQRFPSPRALLTFTAAANLQLLARALGTSQLENGQVRCDGQAEYQAGNIEAHGRVEGRGVMARIPGFRPGPIDFSSSYAADEQRIEFPDLTAKVFGGTAQSKVKVSLAGKAPSFVARTRLEGLDLAASLRSVPQGRATAADFLPSARVGGVLESSWTGVFERLESKFDLSFGAPAGSQTTGSRPLSGFARGLATLTPRLTVALDAAEIHLPQSVINAQGTFDARQSALTLRVETTDFEEWRTVVEQLAEANEPMRLKAPASFSGTLTGPFGNPEIQGRFELGAFESRGWGWDCLQATVQATDSSLQVSEGELQSGPSSLHFEASAQLDNWKLDPDAAVTLRASADRTPLEGLRKALQVAYPLEGFATGRLNLEGKRSDLTGTGVVRIEPGAYDGEPFDRLAAEASVSRSIWALDHVQLTKGSGRLSGHARFDPQSRTLQAAVHGSGFSLSGIKALSRLAGKAAEVASPQGRADLDLTAQGTIDNPDLRSTLDVRDASIGGFALGDFHGRLNWSNHQGEVNGDLTGAAGTLHLAGNVRTEDDWPVELTAQAANLRADPWIRFLRLGKFGATVTTTGSLTLRGPLRNWQQLELQGEIRRVEVSFPQLKWENDRPIELTLAHRTLSLSRFDFVGPSTHFEVEGSARLVAPESLDLQAHGAIDASLLRALDPALLTTGGCDVELRVSGSPARPSLYGTIKVQNVSLAYPSLPVRLSGLKGEVRLDGDRLTVTSLNGSVGRGQVALSGSATLAEVPRFDLRATLEQARVEYPIDFTSALSGDLRLSGSGAAAVLRGNVTVGQMFVSEDFNVISWLSQLTSQPLAAPAGPSSPFASKVRLEVRVTSAPVVSVDSHDLRLIADIDMTLRGTLANPVAIGSVRIENGQAVVRGATYTLTRGSITLANPVQTQPTLDLEAETRVQRYKLVLTVTGPADRPRLAYRSDPPLTTPDILALLAFGYSRQEEYLTAGTGRSTFGTLGASALLNQALSSQKTSRLQRLFGLSRISIDPNPAGSGGARVTVQEQLARNFTVTYVNTTGGLEQRIIQVEWDLSDKVSLLGIRDQNGVYGVELDFRRRFK